MSDDGDAPRPPRLPGRVAARPVQRSATGFAFVALVFIAGGLLALMATVLTGMGYFLVVLGAMFLVGMVFGGHYLLWGVWLDRSLMKGEERPEIDFWKRVPPPSIPPEEEPFGG